MTLQQLHYAITISEIGSLNKAAEILTSRSRPLTGAMQELEKRAWRHDLSPQRPRRYAHQRRRGVHYLRQNRSTTNTSC